MVSWREHNLQTHRVIAHGFAFIAGMLYIPLQFKVDGSVEGVRILDQIYFLTPLLWRQQFAQILYKSSN